jgi:hypothetical protein
MKSKIKITPALFGDPLEAKVYRVDIDLGNNRWAHLDFSEKAWALAEYNRIKGQGIYCSTWIKEITLKEIKNETMA